MLPAERQTHILERINEQGRARTDELAEKLAVTAMTIRRDLADLETKGLLVRTHGGAVTAQSVGLEIPYEAKAASFPDAKVRIAQRAASYVEDGQKIILDAGTTTLEIARCLRGRRNITVVTTDLRIALELSAHRDIEVYCTGGFAQPRVYSLVGPQTVASIESIRVDWAFLGASYVDLDAGITTPGQEKACVKRAMIDAAARSVLVADHSKFGRWAFVRVAPLSRFAAVITDSGLDADLLRRIEQGGIHIERQ